MNDSKPSYTHTETKRCIHLLVSALLAIHHCNKVLKYTLNKRHDSKYCFSVLPNAGLKHTSYAKQLHINFVEYTYYLFSHE